MLLLGVGGEIGKWIALDRVATFVDDNGLCEELLMSTRTHEREATYLRHGLQRHRQVAVDGPTRVLTDALAHLDEGIGKDLVFFLRVNATTTTEHKYAPYRS